MQAEKLKALRQLSSIPIFSLNNETDLPESFGSGCFVNYNNCLFFLTVFHNLEQKELQHMILVDEDPARGAKFLPIGKFGAFGVFDLDTNKGEIIEFAWRRFVDMPPCKCVYRDHVYGEKKRADRIPLTSDFSVIPSNEEEYGFSGLIEASLQPSPIVGTRDEIQQNLILYEGMRYVKSEGEYHFFSLLNNDYEATDFKGISGAPIMDSQGRLVSLLVGGKQLSYDEYQIIGLNLLEVKRILEINNQLAK